jgi:pimeloyl-ACP methyl ester carboxylesterase
MAKQAKRRMQKNRKKSKHRLVILLVLLVLTIAGGDAWAHFTHYVPKPVVVNQVLPTTISMETPGKILSKTAPVTFSVAQVQLLSHEDYGLYTPKAKYAVTKTVVTYRSYDTNGDPLTIHARIYQPVGLTNAPVIAFAPGTTGLGNTCAPSTEDPAKASFANYESHMLTYAGQGYAMVTTDYEGFLDPTRTMHHYMVGPLEGRAVLDSVRALINLDAKTKNIDSNSIFLAGYSQGGHAALWANQIAPSYAPGLSIKGVVGFGSVVNVDETLEDITQGANLSWFGPDVLVSYSDYYHETYPLSTILLPKWIPNLKADVLGICINSDLEFWGTNPANVYTPEFIQALKTHSLAASYPMLAKRMQQNSAAMIATSTPILLNGGAKDIVVLPQQQANALAQLCHNNPSDPVHLHEYPNATHYNTMAISFVDTLQWINLVRNGAAIPNDCTTAA